MKKHTSCVHGACGRSFEVSSRAKREHSPTVSILLRAVNHTLCCCHISAPMPALVCLRSPFCWPGSDPEILILISVPGLAPTTCFLQNSHGSLPLAAQLGIFKRTSSSQSVVRILMPATLLNIHESIWRAKEHGCRRRKWQRACRAGRVWEIWLAVGGRSGRGVLYAHSALLY